MYVVPPMDEEPPPGFVTFVAVHLDTLQAEAARLTGGSQRADEVYPVVLSDVALHWRRLQLRRRLTGRDEAAEYLRRTATRQLAQPVCRLHRPIGQYQIGTSSADRGQRFQHGTPPI